MPTRTSHGQDFAHSTRLSGARMFLQLSLLIGSLFKEPHHVDVRHRHVRCQSLTGCTRQVSPGQHCCDPEPDKGLFARTSSPKTRYCSMHRTSSMVKATVSSSRTNDPTQVDVQSKRCCEEGCHERFVLCGPDDPLINLKGAVGRYRFQERVRRCSMLIGTLTNGGAGFARRIASLDTSICFTRSVRFVLLIEMKRYSDLSHQHPEGCLRIAAYTVSFTWHLHIVRRSSYFRSVAMLEGKKLKSHAWQLPGSNVPFVCSLHKDCASQSMEKTCQVTSHGEINMFRRDALLQIPGCLNRPVYSSSRNETATHCKLHRQRVWNRVVVCDEISRRPEQIQKRSRVCYADGCCKQPTFG